MNPVVWPPESLTLTDGGVETNLIFHDGIELPHFAACALLRTADGRARLERYYGAAARLASVAGLGFSLDTATWRASPDWTDRLGLDAAAFDAVNRDAVRLARKVREGSAEPDRVLISGVLGPRADGYSAAVRQSADDAREYHRRQLTVFAEETVDYAAALTLTYSDEAIGVALAARDVGLPIVLSFTLETDGRLPSGQSLESAIAAVDAATDSGAPVAYFGINCVHPDHLPPELFSGAAWTARVRAYRANASRQSHAELDEAEQLDDGDPAELGSQFGAVVARLPQLAVVGGCCGTDARHLTAIAARVRSARPGPEPRRAKAPPE